MDVALFQKNQILSHRPMDIGIGVALNGKSPSPRNNIKTPSIFS